MAVNSFSRSSASGAAKQSRSMTGALPIDVSGGVLSEDANYYYRTFTSNGTLKVSNGVLRANVIVIGGGGGGGAGTSWYGAGGGGAGGFVKQSATLGSSTTVVIGAGGAGMIGSFTSTPGDSGITTYFGSIAAIGGGGGASGDWSAHNGVSGGSGGGSTQGATPGSGTANQGHDGGYGTTDYGIYNSGGGGGAGSVGGDATMDYAGNGGSGIKFLNSYYAGGGGGGPQSGYDGGIGGSGVGGNGAPMFVYSGRDAVKNTGSGGGGGGGDDMMARGGNGSSGIVIVQYPKSNVGQSASDYELIGTVELTARQSTITFTGIPQGIYKHLQIKAVARTTRGASYNGAKITFNGGVGTDYAYHELVGNGSSASAYADAATTKAYIGIGSFASSSSTAGQFGVMTLDILDAFSTTKNKTLRSLSGQSGTFSSVYLNSNCWFSTDAITSMVIEPDVSSNWDIGTRFSLYGLKA